MSYEHRNSEDRKDDGREPGKPHPDADRNFNYALEKLKSVKLIKSECYPIEFDVKFYDYDYKTNKITEPKYIAFYWKKNGDRYGNNISFHQSSQKFTEEMDNAIKWCISSGYATRTELGAFR